MLIDWVTCRVPIQFLTDQAREKALTLGDRIQRYCPLTGDVRYESIAWDSIASDSHQINIRASGHDFWIMGSPARVMGDGCSVFGTGASSRLDLAGCIDAMRLFAMQGTGIELPADLSLWTVSRVDVTENLLLGSLSEVRDALRILRDCEGGRYRVSQQAGDTVYWSQKSKLRKGKAYAKGPHLSYQMSRTGYTGRQYTRDEIDQANRLLRLELTLGREFWNRNDWKACTAETLRMQWHDYFDRMIGGAEVTTDNDLKQRIFAAAEVSTQREFDNAMTNWRERRVKALAAGKPIPDKPRARNAQNAARAAYGAWLLIQAEGWERARESFTKTVWYRHLSILRAAGLGDADISAGKVVPFRRKVMEARAVCSWHELKIA
ncbi:phage/plasmid replication protein, gene II/X family [Halopseudomonas formosensis]|uniref:Phage/plasmid replication protein, gene II/X family n=1 Tax=Halopseudomonas formosensis TaxID=1002526 RepID=A0A1I6BZL9_9GAMM|nr:phage/plasmid replication protein, II/X family [Halopseudomonas formosensis]SFQ86382.1 phage/plasmid replication protein, gene II/X family [Halopseudomonas formosensis]